MRRFVIVCFYLFAGGVLAAVYNSPSKKLTGKPNQNQYVDYSSSVYSPYMLPCMLIILGILMPMMGIFDVYDFVYGILFPAFTELALYYGILILLAPYLRGKLRPKACAALWILPNLMYVGYTQPLWRQKPDVVISFSQTIAYIIMIVWIMGFVLVMGSYIFSHLSFRKRILKNARQVWNMKVLSVWFDELKNSGCKIQRDALLISSQLTSPLTIGLFRKAVRIILPDKDYTDQQLRLIFRHELVHLTKNDNGSKFFFAICNALCWFNPLMWGAMKHCAEDLERSCDEAVLIDANDQERRLYTELILDSEADQRGFTTCLSASAASLRNRLKTILEPKKMWSGALALFVVVSLLSMMTGRTAFAYGKTHLDFDSFGSAVRAEMRQHDEDYYTEDDIDEVDPSLVQNLMVLQLDELSLMYKDSFTCELCLSIKFENNSRYSLKMAEIDGGVLIQEDKAGKGYSTKLYFCKGLTLESVTEMMNIEN